MDDEISLDDLISELCRLCDRYFDEPMSIEALEAVKFWAMEEKVPGIDDKFENQTTSVKALLDELGRLRNRFNGEPDAIDALQDVRRWAEEMDEEDMTERTRLIFGLRYLGLNDTEIVNFILWMESGDSKFKPGPFSKREKGSK